MNEIKIGFIGCGGNASGHMSAISRLANVRVVGVCDIVEELARKAAQNLNCKAYTDHRRLFDEGAPDAVIISIPVFAHGDVELEAAERGIHFLVEKPVALDMATALKVQKAVQEKNLITSVGYQLRYTATAQKAKAFIEGRKVGLVEGRYWCGSIRNRNSWHAVMEKSGGQLVEQATHTIDLMRYLVGDVEEVYSLQDARLLEDAEAPDVYAATIKFKGDAIGSITSTWAMGVNDWSNANIINIFFDKYHMKWSVSEPILNPEEDEWKELNFQGRDINTVFINAIATGDDSAIISDYEDGVKSLAVSLAANKSARLRRPVKLEEMFAL